MQSKGECMKEYVRFYLQNTGILIGSRRFHVNTPDADYDFVLNMANLEQVRFMLREKGIIYTYKTAYSGPLLMHNDVLIECVIEGTTFQMLFYPEKEYRCFIQINTLMSSLMAGRKDAFLHKDVRVSVYNALLQAVFISKGFIPPPIQMKSKKKKEELDDISLQI
jgi:hypothetical protein